MSDGIHKVVLYVQEKSKQFSITARMQRSQLAGVDSQMRQLGFDRIVVAEHLNKSDAEKLRDAKREQYTSSGYAYQTRDQL